MTLQNLKRARILLAASLVASLLIIAGVTGLYYWKGLEKLKPKDEYSKSYFVLH